MKAILDFTNKTISFQGNAKLEDIKIIQDSLVNWREWVVIGQPVLSVSGAYKSNPLALRDGNGNLLIPRDTNTVFCGKTIET